MDFSLSEEQTLLQDSVNRYIENDYSFSQRRASIAESADFDRQHWASFAELGWLGIPFSQASGGYGGKLEDVAIVFEAFGRGLVREPYLASVILGGQLLTGAQHQATVSAIIDGTHHAALAALERQSRQNFSDVLTSAKPNADGFVLNGSKVLVLNGAAANTLVITARTAGDQFDPSGISLFALGADSAGITRTTIPTMDGSCVANIELDNVTVPANALLGELNGGWPALHAVTQQARIALCAEAVGIIDTLRTKTVEYSRTRTQFGTTIGSFQALQHRMVDMLIAAEQSRSMLYRAICEYQQNEPSASSTIAAMKALIAKHGRYVGEEAIQLHGGMGMTDELDIGHYVKRLMVLNQLFGDADAATREFCDAAYAA